jgi:predicted DNA binding protein
MHHRAKLTPDQVRQIRAAYKPGVFGYVRLSRLFGVAESTIRDILTYRTRWNV